MTIASRDPGLQSERTALSWRRTMLTALVVGIVCVRAAVVAPTVWLVSAAAVVVVIIGLAAYGQIERFRRNRADPTDPRALPVALLAGISGLIAVAAGLCLVDLIAALIAG